MRLASDQLVDTDYFVDVSADGVTIRAVDASGAELVGVRIERGWPRRVSVWADERLDFVLSGHEVRFLEGGGLSGMYAATSQIEGVLAPYAHLFALALPLVTDERIADLMRDGVLSVGAPTLQSAGISGSEGYWCGVGAAGAMIIGGPGSAFLYAIACGMWADMDSW